MEALLYFLLFYSIGAILAYFVALHYIKKYRTNDSPISHHYLVGF